MKFSESWLRSFIEPEPALSSEQLGERLTMLGLEVDAIEPAGSLHERIVVAEVQSVTPLSERAPANVCAVSVGAGSPLLDVVCTAPNLKAGMKTALAQVGAEVAGRRIEARKVHGVVSQGMLVSEAEIGLGDDAGEIIELDALSAPGARISEVLGIDNDACISLDVTPDRGDCFGVLGVARDLAASLGANLKLPEVELPSETITTRIAVQLEASQACARFLSAVCADIDHRARSPMWLRERLRRSGLRCIHPAVDITNYVMLELGRPLHAFDRAKVEGGLIVRYGRTEEQLTLIDGKQVALDHDALAVCDSRRPLSLAGIMGDAASGVTAETRDVVFECAWFNPRVIARTARRLGIQSDSSIRFERGVDPGLMAFGMSRARALIAAVCKARLGPVTEATSAEHLPRKVSHRLRASQVTRLIGQKIAPSFVEEGLRRLGFGVSAPSMPSTLNDASWQIEVPSHRFDIEGEADLVEEVARLHGFEAIPEMPCDGLRRPSRHVTSVRRLREFVAALGYREVMSYSFLPADSIGMGNESDAHLTLQNPMSSDQAVMRRSLLPGLLRVLAGNLARHHARVRVFELGRVFLEKHADVNAQPLRLAALHCGDQWPESWGQARRTVDFFDIKGDVERVLALNGWDGHSIDWQPSLDPRCHPGRSASLCLNGEHMGIVAELHPHLLRQADIGLPVCFFEVNVDVLARRCVATFEAPSKFPQVRRDIALLVNRDLPVCKLLDIARQAGEALVCEVDVFDVYQGEGVDAHDKSVAIRLTFQSPERTLRDEEVSLHMERILAALKDSCRARLRGTSHR